MRTPIHIPTLCLLLYYSFVSRPIWAENPPPRPTPAKPLQAEDVNSKIPLVIQIVTLQKSVFSSYVASIRRTDKAVDVPCSDTISNNYDEPNDGIYSCVSIGEYTKTTAMSIYGIQNGQRTLLYSGAARTDNISQPFISFQLIQGMNGPMLMRNSYHHNQSAFTMLQNNWHWVGIAWSILIMHFVGMLVLHTRK